MEYFNDLEIVCLKNEDYNIYTKAHFIFFSIVEEQIKLLFLKKENSSEKYSFITTTLLPEDTAPTFAVARILSTKFLSLFNKGNIHKMHKQEDLTKDDIIEDKEFHYHELWENKYFHEWLVNLTEKPIIQYDTIKGHQFYFYEIPNLENLNKINENLKSLNIDYSMKYFDANSFISENNDLLHKEMNPTLIKFLFSFNIENYIKDTLAAISKNTLTKFFILSIKPPEGTKQDQAGFFHFPALFQGIYRKNTENWIYLVCSIDKLPSEEDLENTKGIIIPGSHLTVYDDIDFLRKTEQWINQFHLSNKNVKFLGICFGLQIFMTAMGGKVEKMNTPFVRGPTKIEIEDSFWELEFVRKSGVNKSKSLYMMQAHGDECTFVPDDLKLKNYGKSDSCFNEILVNNDERVVLVQGHPEYHPSFNIERMAPFYLMREGKEKTLENILEVKKKMREDFNVVNTNSNEFRSICNSFLKN